MLAKEGKARREPNKKSEHQKSKTTTKEGKEREEPQQREAPRRVGVTKDEHKKKERTRERGGGVRDYIIVLSFQETQGVFARKKTKV